MKEIRTEIVVLFILGWLYYNCFPSTQGEDPNLRKDYFYYPVSIQLSYDNNYLFVVNSDFDLLYNSGYVVVVDLVPIKRMISSCRNEEDSWGCGQDLYIIPSQEEVDDLYKIRFGVIDYLMEDETVLIAPYAGTCELSPKSNTLYIAIQGDGTLTYIKINNNRSRGERLLVCNESLEKGVQRCSSQYKISKGLPPEYTPSLPSSPFAVKVWTLEENGTEYIIVGHIHYGEVSLFKVDSNGVPVLVDVNKEFELGNTSIVHRPNTREFLALSRSSSVIKVFTIIHDKIAIIREFSIDGVEPATDQRWGVFSSDGRYLYVTSRKPPSVIVIDMGEVNKEVKNELIDVIDVGAGPSFLSLWKEEDEEELLFVVCFDDMALYVIDTKSREVIKVISTKVGPHHFIIDPINKVAYLVNFTESTVSIVDIDRKSPLYLSIIFNLGKPKHPREIR